jgi:hypothetical protein
MIPTPRGTLTPDRPLADLTWLRVGGPADWLFQPADVDDLAAFLRDLDPSVPVFPMGVGSNLIVRDGGIRGVVVRLGRGFNAIEVEDGRVTAGAAALDAHVARKAAEAGIDLTFLRTIPGAIGGAVRMNAGCYGSYVADHFVGATAVTRAGEVVTLTPADMGFAYRQTALPPDMVIVSATFSGDGRPACQARRDAAHEGPHGGVHVPQSGRFLLDRAGRRHARTEGLEADPGRRVAGRAARRGGDERDARELPYQRRRGDRRRARGAWRNRAPKGIPNQWNIARMGNHAGRRNGPV